MRPENRARLGAHDVILAAHPGSGSSWIGTLLVELGIFHASGHDELLLDDRTQRTGGWLGAEAAADRARGLPRPVLPEDQRRKHLARLHARDERGAWREPLRVILTNDSALGAAVSHPVVLFVRDGRDALLSLHHHLVGFAGLDVDFATFLSGHDGAWPPPALSWGVGNWSWVGATPPERLCVLRFEDCRADPAREFGRLLAFLGVERTPEELARAIDRASYATMRREESRSVTTDAPRFMRRGEIGEWRSAYTPALLAHWRGLPNRVLAHFGYAG